MKQGTKLISRRCISNEGLRAGKRPARNQEGERRRANRKNGKGLERPIYGGSDPNKSINMKRYTTSFIITPGKY